MAPDTESRTGHLMPLRCGQVFNLTNKLAVVNAAYESPAEAGHEHAANEEVLTESPQLENCPPAMCSSALVRRIVTGIATSGSAAAR
jgi:hypothetical protein